MLFNSIFDLAFIKKLTALFPIKLDSKKFDLAAGA